MGGTFHAPDDWLGHVRDSTPAGAELELVPIEVPAGGAAFHDGWTFHGSPPNERADAERRSIISHMVSTGDDAGATARRTRSTRATGGPASASSTRRSSPCSGSDDGRRTAWLGGWASHSRSSRVDGRVVEQREVVRAADAAARLVAERDPPRAAAAGRARRAARAQSPSSRPTGWRSVARDRRRDEAVRRARRAAAPPRRPRRAARRGRCPSQSRVDERAVAQVADAGAAAAQEARERARLGQRVQRVRA